MPELHYTRYDVNRRMKTVPCLVRPAALEHLAEEDHAILVGVGDGGTCVNRALVEPEMIYEDDGETEKGLVWNVFSADEDDPHDTRDGRFYSSEGTPEEALRAAEVWALEHA